MSPILDLVAKHAAAWSETANQLKKRLDLVRWIVFCLSIAGALVAAIASQIVPEAGAAAGQLPKSHAVFATLGAVLLAAVTFLSGRLLRDAQVQAWVRARAASEALKREAFKFAARANPYDGPNADELLKMERERIEGPLADLCDHRAEAMEEGSAPRSELSPEQYRERRVRHQSTGILKRLMAIEQSSNASAGLKTALASVATIVTALAGT